MEFVTKITDLLDKIPVDIAPSIKLGAIGGVVILVLFLIALAIGAGSKITRYRKMLLAGTKRLNAQPPITDDKVGIVYDELAGHPERVKKGWQAFLDQRKGYPSDYITEKDALSAREFSGKGTAAKVFLIVAGALVWAFVAVVGFLSGMADDATTVQSALIAVEFVVIPVACYVIALLLLDINFNRKIRRLELTFRSFCEVLDAKIVVSDKDEKEFVSDNLEEINKRVAELIEGRLSGEEIIEVVTAPAVAEVEETDEETLDDVVSADAEEPVKEEPVAEPVEDDVPNLAEMTDEEKFNYFSLLYDVVERAMADEKCTEDDYALIALAINDEAVRSGAVNNPEDMEIFEDCFRMLASKMSD